MKNVRLYHPSKTAMQSGKAKTKGWILEIATPDAKFHDPVMGWTGTTDTSSEEQLFFPTKEEALAYCQANNLSPTLMDEGEEPAPQPKSYGDNFTKGLRY